MTCQLKIRFPNGETIEQTFGEDDPLLVVAEFCKTKVSGKYLLSVPFPRKIFDDAELVDLTLKKAGLCPKGMLIVQHGIATDMKVDTTPIVKPGVRHCHTEQEYNACKSVPNKLVVVDFSASWCGPCQRIAPIFEQLATKYVNVVFVHVDVDELPNLPDVADVRGVPTFKFFKNKQLLEAFSGANPDRLEESIRKFS